MAVSTGIPTSWNLPLFWATVDGSKAGSLTEHQRALLIGCMHEATTLNMTKGTATLDVPIPIGSVALAQQSFGVGSMLARMVEAFFNSNTTQELWCLPVAAPSAGVAALGSITFTSQATASGTYDVYIGGQKVSILVQTTDVVGTLATNLAAAITAMTSLPVTAAAVSGAVNLTTKWKGLTGNDIRIIENYLGFYGGEVTPVGLTTTIVQMGAGTAGTSAPTFTNAIAAIQSIEFDYVGFPFLDTASLAVINTEMGFSAGGRWNFTRQQYGIVVNAVRGTSQATSYSDLITMGLTVPWNSPVMSTMAVEFGSPTPTWEWTAAYCATAALGFSADPARPLHTLELIGLLPAPVATRFSQSQNNALTNGGFAVQSMAPSGNPMVLREQTQYQFNQYGQGDTAFGLLTVVTTLQELLRRMKAAITSKYPRVKLIPDGTKIGPGQAAITPSDVKAELVSEYSNAMYDGLCADMANFKKYLIVEIDNNDPNQLNVLWPPRLAGQLRSFQALAQFRLQYPVQSAA